MKALITLLIIIGASYGAYKFVISLENEKEGEVLQKSQKIAQQLKKKITERAKALQAKVLPKKDDLDLKFAIELISNQSNDEIKEAIEENSDLINYRDKFGRLFLNEVIKRNNSEIFEFLISKSVEVNTTDEDGFSPLMEAVKNNSTNFFEALLENGASINLKNSQGRDVLITATEYNKPKFIELALQNGANPDTTFTNLALTPIMMASINDTPELISIFKKYNASINHKDSNGRTSLHHASMEANAEVIKTLISNGAKIEKDDSGKLPIDYAKENGDADIVSLFEEM